MSEPIIQIRIGIALIPYFRGNELKPYIQQLRKDIQKQYDAYLPSVNIIDDASLVPFASFTINFMGEEMFRHEFDTEEKGNGNVVSYVNELLTQLVHQHIKRIRIHALFEEKSR